MILNILEKIKHHKMAIIKVVFSIIVLSFIISNVSIVEFKETLSRCSLKVIVYSVLSLWGCYLCSAYRWFLIVKKNIAIPASLCFKATAVGVFLNQCLPSSIGGDVYRYLILVKHGLAKNTALRTLVLDRGIGFFFMGLLGVLSGLFLILLQKRTDLLSLSISFGMHWYFFTSVLMVAGCFFLYCDWGSVRGKSFVFLDKIIDWFSDFVSWTRQILSGRIFVQFVMGVGATTFLYLPIVFLIHSLELNVGVLEVMLLLPVIFLVSTFPFSFGGWGVREGIFVVSLSMFGVSVSNACLVSMLFGALCLLSALPCGVFYFVKVKKVI